MAKLMALRWQDIRQGHGCWQPAPPIAAPDSPFRVLVGPAWNGLPVAVQARFARHIPANACVSYAGEIVHCRISRAGWWLAQIARLIGAPLPLSTDVGVAASVSVTGDADGRSQHWTRQYGRLGRPPQVIHSAKRFAGPTGIEEYLGCGIGIALTLRVEDDALFFDSDHVFVRAGPIRVRLPGWLNPGQMTVGHIDMGGGRFAFTLDLHHRWLGELFHQIALFSDTAVAR